MEPGDSTHSLLSYRHSESGSNNVLESGVYMSSFAATVLVAALVTIGVLMLTLLIALTAMLQSCQRTSSDVFQQVRTSDLHDYCQFVTFNAEINYLKEEEYPTICKQNALQFIAQGRMLQDLNLTVKVAESYLSTLQPHDDGLDVILMDADDILLSDINYNSSSAHFWSSQVEDMKHLSRMLVLRLLVKLRSSGWSLRLFTRKTLGDVNTTIVCFTVDSYRECSSLIPRSDDELLLDSWDYISRRRVQLHKEGFRIASIISCRMDALQGPPPVNRNFKLACPSHYWLS